MDNGVYFYENGNWVQKEPDFSKGFHVIYFDNIKCGACRLLDPYWELAIKKLGDEKVRFWMVICNWFEHDCDSETAKKLFIDYEITASPTLIIVRDGEVVDRISGVLSTGELLAWIKNVISGKPKDKEKKKPKLGFYC